MAYSARLLSLHREDHASGNITATRTDLMPPRDMLPSLLRTKLHPPLLPPNSVARPRLVKVLKRAIDYPLTLVSAPTGFGKSTLVVQALADIDAPCAWLTLDERDNDLVGFLNYLIAAVHTELPDACSQTRRLLGGVQTPPVEDLAGSLLNELQAILTPFVVVLDDFHHLSDPTVHQFFASLLRNPPPPLHLVLITQSDPPWRLARLLARGQMLEIRAADLRFRLDEAQKFLETATGRALPKTTVESLVEQTEGWIISLRLAALARATEPHWGLSLDGLSGPHHPLAPRFLVHEVLARQSPAVRDFLLRTSILDRLSVPLCAALMNLEPGDADRPTTESIEAWLRDTNLFIVPLGEASQWYRYHHLFRNLLRHELTAEWDAERVRGLHRRAANWFAEHGLVEDAVQHAVAAGDTAHAAEIVESQVQAQLNRENWRGVDHSLALLGDDLVRQRPSLLVARAWVAGMRQESRSVVPLVGAAAAIVADLQSPLSESERRVAQAEIACLRAYGLWWGEGQAQSSLVCAREALAGLPASYSFARSVCFNVEGLGLYTNGRGREAVDLLRQVVADPSEPVVVKTRVTLALTIIRRAAGPLFALQEAIDLYLKIADEDDLPTSRLWAHYLLGSLHYERNELEPAVEQLEFVAQRHYLAHFFCGRDTLLELALAYQAQGRVRDAHATARKLAQFCLERSGAGAIESRSLTVRLALARQDVDEALRNAAILPDVAPISGLFLAEVPPITRAQALLATGETYERRQALELLSNLESIADASHTLRPLVRILALQAVGLAADGHDAEALAKLERAVVLAERMGLIRTFVDAGPSLAPLLHKVMERGVAPAYLRQVLAALSKRQLAQPPRLIAHDGELLEPLTYREIEALRLLEERLSTKEIAVRLDISYSTAKRHVNNVMGKLSVHNRREVVERARAIGLLPSR